MNKERPSVIRLIKAHQISWLPTRNRVVVSWQDSRNCSISNSIMYELLWKMCSNEWKTFISSQIFTAATTAICRDSMWFSNWSVLWSTFTSKSVQFDGNKRNGRSSSWSKSTRVECILQQSSGHARCCVALFGPKGSVNMIYLDRLECFSSALYISISLTPNVHKLRCRIYDLWSHSVLEGRGRISELVVWVNCAEGVPPKPPWKATSTLPFRKKSKIFKKIRGFFIPNFSSLFPGRVYRIKSRVGPIGWDW